MNLILNKIILLQIEIQTYLPIGDNDLFEAEKATSQRSNSVHILFTGRPLTMSTL